MLERLPRKGRFAAYLESHGQRWVLEHADESGHLLVSQVATDRPWAIDLRYNDSGRNDLAVKSQGQVFADMAGGELAETCNGLTPHLKVDPGQTGLVGTYADA